MDGKKTEKKMVTMRLLDPGAQALLERTYKAKAAAAALEAEQNAKSEMGAAEVQAVAKDVGE